MLFVERRGVKLTAADSFGRSIHRVPADPPPPHGVASLLHILLAARQAFYASVHPNHCEYEIDDEPTVAIRKFSPCGR